MPVPEDLDGRVIAEMLVDPGARPPIRVASYEKLIERAGAGPREAPVDEAYRERLRALGYVQ